MPQVERAGDWIVNQLLAHAEIEERKSRFADRSALFFRGKEFFHLDAPGIADLRLGRQKMRSHIDALRCNPRIHFRTNSSDWIQIHFRSRKDAQDVLAWARVAIGVNRAVQLADATAGDRARGASPPLGR